MAATYKGNLSLDKQTEGKWGTCAWALYKDGTLRIGPGIGIDTADWDGDPTPPGFEKYRAGITSVVMNSDQMTGQKVILPQRCDGMFAGYNRLRSADLSGADAMSVMEMSGMFEECKLLEKVGGFGNLDTRNVREADRVFAGCESLRAVDVKKFGTASLETAAYMFDGCSSLIHADISEWDMSAFEPDRNPASRMFGYCTSLETVAFPPEVRSGVLDGGNVLYASRSVLSIEGWENMEAADAQALEEECPLAEHPSIGGSEYTFPAPQYLETKRSAFAPGMTAEWECPFGPMQELKVEISRAAEGEAPYSMRIITPDGRPAVAEGGFEKFGDAYLAAASAMQGKFPEIGQPILFERETTLDKLWEEGVEEPQVVKPGMRIDREPAKLVRMAAPAAYDRPR